MHHRRHALLLGRWVVSDEHVVDHPLSGPFAPLGRQGGEVDRGSKGAKGEVGTAKGSPFSPDAPGLGCCNDFKDASKAAAPPRLTALVSPIRTPRTLTACDAVALELVR